MQPVIVWDQSTGSRVVQVMFWRFLLLFIPPPEEIQSRHDQCEGRGYSYQQNVALSVSEQPVPSYPSGFLHRMAASGQENEAALGFHQERRRAPRPGWPVVPTARDPAIHLTAAGCQTGRDCLHQLLRA